MLLQISSNIFLEYIESVKKYYVGNILDGNIKRSVYLEVVG